MAGLTSFLQAEFARQPPNEWQCRHETPVLPADLERLLGYAPRADVILERIDGARRLWIEFEVSRADPVANHAKFATAHLFSQQRPTDTFISMVSAHVVRGRRNLASNMIYVMRALGMRAFQTTLLPHLAAAEVQRLNSINYEALRAEAIPVQAEIERAIVVSEPVSGHQDQDIHLAGEPVQALLNLRHWNDVNRPEFCRDSAHWDAAGSSGAVGWARSASNSAGGRMPSSPCSRRWLNQSTYSRVAYSTSSRPRQGPRWRISSAL